MPTYTFICRDCSTKFDVFTSMSNKSSTVCSECHSDQLREEFGPVYIGGQLSRSHAGHTGCSKGSCATCSTKC